MLRDFGDKVFDHRVKQMIGHMVKQIMDAAGYEIDQQKVEMESIPFYAGTRYKRRDDRTYHVWHKGSDARSCALTPDKLGSKLPPLTCGLMRNGLPPDQRPEGRASAILLVRGEVDREGGGASCDSRFRGRRRTASCGCRWPFQSASSCNLSKPTPSQLTTITITPVSDIAGHFC